MKKEMKVKVLSFMFVSLFVIILFSNFVLAQQAQQIFDPIKDLFVRWGEGQLSINISKYLFMILLALLVYSIIDASGIVPQRGINVLISAIVGFLGVAYLAPAEIWATLTTYSALGLTLLFFVPLIILFFFTTRVILYGGATGVVAQWAIWVIYLLFLIYRFATGWINNQITGNARWMFILVIIITIVMVFFNGVIRRFIGEQFFQAEVERARGTMEKAVEMRRIEAEGFQRQAGGRRRGLANP